MGLKTRWMEILGYGGLIPFIGLGVASALLRESDLVGLFAHINLVYGTTIVAFLGAVHWGIVLAYATNDTAEFKARQSPEAFETIGLIWGVTPALFAWLVMSFAPSDYVHLSLAVLLVFIWLIDRKLLGPLQAFEAYLKLRNHLTIGAIAGLLITAWAI